MQDEHDSNDQVSQATAHRFVHFTLILFGDLENLARKRAGIRVLSNSKRVCTRDPVSFGGVTTMYMYGSRRHLFFFLTFLRECRKVSM